MTIEYLKNPKSSSILILRWQSIQAIRECKKGMLEQRRSKKHSLSKEDKKGNTALAQERVLVENVIGMLKRFKIISDCYRNRRKSFGLRFITFWLGCTTINSKFRS